MVLEDDLQLSAVQGLVDLPLLNHLHGLLRVVHLHRGVLERVRALGSTKADLRRGIFINIPS